MSGGQQEMQALEDDVRRVRDAARALADALKEASVGYHGVSVADAELAEVVNDELAEVQWSAKPPRGRKWPVVVG